MPFYYWRQAPGQAPSGPSGALARQVVRSRLRQDRQTRRRQGQVIRRPDHQLPDHQGRVVGRQGQGVRRRQVVRLVVSQVRPSARQLVSHLLFVRQALTRLAFRQVRPSGRRQALTCPDRRRPRFIKPYRTVIIHPSRPSRTYRHRPSYRLSSVISSDRTIIACHHPINVAAVDTADRPTPYIRPCCHRHTAGHCHPSSSSTTVTDNRLTVPLLSVVPR